MTQSLTNQIKNKIENLNEGELLTTTEFIDLGKYDTIKRLLIRLENKGIIKRVFDGIYFKPKFSKLTNELVFPSIYNVAEKIAEKYSWEIIPTGNTALNLLNLSTQIPAKFEYLSSGPYRNYSVNNHKLSFKHMTNKNMLNLSKESSLVVQGIKAIGQSNMNDKVINIIEQSFSSEQINKIRKETKRVTSWIYEEIKKMNGERQYD